MLKRSEKKRGGEVDGVKEDQMAIVENVKTRDLTAKTKRRHYWEDREKRKEWDQKEQIRGEIRKSWKESQEERNYQQCHMLHRNQEE